MMRFLAAEACNSRQCPATLNLANRWRGIVHISCLQGRPCGKAALQQAVERVPEGQGAQKIFTLVFRYIRCTGALSPSH